MVKWYPVSAFISASQTQIRGLHSGYNFHHNTGMELLRKHNMLTSEDEVPYWQIQDPGIKVEHNGIPLQRSVEVLEAASLQEVRSRVGKLLVTRRLLIQACLFSWVMPLLLRSLTDCPLCIHKSRGSLPAQALGLKWLSFLLAYYLPSNRAPSADVWESLLVHDLQGQDLSSPASLILILIEPMDPNKQDS